MTDHKSSTPRASQPSKAEGVTEKVVTEAAKARDSVKDMARDAADTARDKAREVADSARDKAAERVETAAEAIDAATERLPAGSFEEQAMEKVASTIRDAANAVSGTRLESVLGDVERIARRNPVAFAATAAVLGFAVARMVKASERRAHDPHRDGGPDWQRPVPTDVRRAEYDGAAVSRGIDQ